jgi:hypothetical protein
MIELASLHQSDLHCMIHVRNLQMPEEFVRRLAHYEASDFRISISTNTNPILGKGDRSGLSQV